MTAPGSVATKTRPPRTERLSRSRTRLILLLSAAVVIGLVCLAAVLPTTKWVGSTGYLMTAREVEVRPSVEGVIDRWLVSSGQTVPAGTPLIQLKDAVQRAAREQAQRELAARRAEVDQLRTAQELERSRLREQVNQARASLALAQSQLERMTVSGGFSPKEIEDAQLRVDLATSRLAELELPREPLMSQQLQVLAEQIGAAEKLVTLRQAELDLRLVRAPIDGQVYFNRFEPGELVKPEHVLGQVFDRSAWVVKLKLAERQVASVTIGEPVAVSLSAYPSWRFGQATGRVTRISPVITPRPTGDGVFYVEATLDQVASDRALSFQPGMTATAWIDSGRTTWLFRLLGL